MTKISVVIPAYNAAQTLERAVSSALEQTFCDLEVLIVDDGSSDDTAKIARVLAQRDPRVRCLGEKNNSGVGRARNRALDAACGDWIALLDADDWMAPDRLERMLAAAQEHNAQVAFDDLVVEDREKGECILTTRFGQGGPRAVSLFELFSRDTPYEVFSIGYVQPIVQASFLKEKGIRYNEEYKMGEDFTFMAELALCGARVIALPFALYHYAHSVQPSGLSQDSYKTVDAKYTPVLESADRLLALYSADISPALLKAVRRRRRLFERLARLRGIALLARRGGFIKASIALLMAPTCWWFLVRLVVCRFPYMGAQHLAFVRMR